MNKKISKLYNPKYKKKNKNYKKNKIHKIYKNNC